VTAFLSKDANCRKLAITLVTEWLQDPGRDATGRGTHRVAGEVARPRLPQNVACSFTALRSSEVGSQRRS
jgi:hypothetical protein